MEWIGSGVVLGYVSGVVGYGYYLFFVERTGYRGFWLLMVGLQLSGMMGALFALMMGGGVGVSIVGGLMSFYLYTGMVTAFRNGSILGALREVLIKLLTGGK